MSSPVIKFRAAMREIIDEALSEAEVWDTCLHCVHFKEHEGEVCVLATPPARPPARIIAFGCTAFREVAATVVNHESSDTSPFQQEPKLNPAYVRQMMEYDDDIPF